MTNQLRTLGIAALLAQSLVFFACSSAGTATGTGGTPGTAGTGSGSGGTTGGGQGGMTSSGGGMSGTCVEHPGSCTCLADNPDSVAGGACASDCQSVSCGKPCRENCCVPCGIDASGTKTCTCTMPGQAYTNCTCSPPPTFPIGLSGGLCSPQGYAATTPPAGAPAGSISLKGIPCTVNNAVCFTADSTPSSERGCICQGGTMHCGSVNHWFVNSGAAATPY
jgi:hypothetical protein